jgi:(p)ppGpp synthase/HD superfamily hydrolase
MAFYNEAIIKAYLFAKEAHEGQYRKFSGQDYFSHPLAVANILADNKSTEYQIILGFLHDTIEDTKTTYEDVNKGFGKEIADGVLLLTNDGDKIKKIGKKQMMYEKILSLPKQELTVKMADRLHNITDSNLDTMDKKFVRKYYDETVNYFLKAYDERFKVTTSLHAAPLYFSIKRIMQKIKIKYIDEK